MTIIIRPFDFWKKNIASQADEGRGSPAWILRWRGSRSRQRGSSRQRRLVSPAWVLPQRDPVRAGVGGPCWRGLRHAGEGATLARLYSHWPRKGTLARAKPRWRVSHADVGHVLAGEGVHAGKGPSPRCRGTRASEAMPTLARGSTLARAKASLASVPRWRGSV